MGELVELYAKDLTHPRYRPTAEYLLFTDRRGDFRGIYKGTLP
jgi:hypothetical protein